VEEVNARSHASCRRPQRLTHLLRSINSLDLPLLALPSLSWTGVVQILSAVGLFLPTRGSLPLLKLLIDDAFRILYGNYWLTLGLTDKRLQFMLDLGLLLLQVL
jgi:hypothetical protein